MILYHASYTEIKTPDTLHSREDIDFGRGFYLTSIKEQAISYAQRFIRRGKDAWLNIYEFNISTDEWKILNFEAYDSDWLDFISQCRAGKDDTDYDIVIGGIANDRVIQTLDRYFAGELNSEQTLGLLKYEKPNIQYCIRSQKMLDKCLIHIRSTNL